MIIRKEEPRDYSQVFSLIKNAFEDEPLSDHKEQFLVERLRKSNAFVPELSLVAEKDYEIIGYILLTKIKIIDNNSTYINNLALAPVAVLKKYQNKGIGSGLIKKAHQIAKALKFDSIILLGHKDYYPKFGYKMAKNYGIKLPFDVPEENCLILELFENSLNGVSGIVEYPKEFFD